MSLYFGVKEACKYQHIKQVTTLLWAVQLCRNQQGYKVMSRRITKITVLLCFLCVGVNILQEEENSSEKLCHPCSWQKSPSVVQHGAIYCPPHKLHVAGWFCHLSSQLISYFHSQFWKVTFTCSSWSTGKASYKMFYSIMFRERIMDNFCKLAHACVMHVF